MGSFNTDKARHKITWQSLEDLNVEVEITGSEAASKKDIIEFVVEMLALVSEYEGKFLLMSDGDYFCLEISFTNDQNKKLFLERLPVEQ